MQKTEQIVVDIERPGDAEQPALAAAQASAGKDAKVHLFHNVYHRNIISDEGPDNQVLGEARDLLLESRQRKLDELADVHLGERADSALVWSEKGWQELIRFAIHQQCDLVIAQSLQRSRWRRLSPGNDDWELIRHCPLPLLLARQGSPKRYERIVAAVDPLHADDKPADLDRQILRLAARFSQHHKATLSVINVVAMTMAVPPATLEPVAPSVGINHEAVAAHKKKVAELVSELDCTVADTAVFSGVPGDEIVHYVKEQKADLVVMGAVSRSMLARLLIGNTAERVLDALPCDVLIVKPPKFDARLPAIAALMGTWTELL